MKSQVMHLLAFARVLIGRAGLLLFALVLLTVLTPIATICFVFGKSSARLLDTIALSLFYFALVPQLLLYAVTILLCQTWKDSGGRRSFMPVDLRTLPIGYPKYVMLQLILGMSAMALCAVFTDALALYATGTWFALLPAILLFTTFYALSAAIFTMVHSRIALVFSFILLEVLAITFAFKMPAFLLTSYPNPYWVFCILLDLTAYSFATVGVSKEPNISTNRWPVRAVLPEREHSRCTFSFVHNLKVPLVNLTCLEYRNIAWMVPSLFLVFIALDLVLAFAIKETAQSGLALTPTVSLFLTYLGGFFLGLRYRSTGHDSPNGFAYTLPVGFGKLAISVALSIFSATFISYLLIVIGDFLVVGGEHIGEAVEEVFWMFIAGWACLGAGFCAILSQRAHYVLMAVFSLPILILAEALNPEATYIVPCLLWGLFVLLVLHIGLASLRCIRMNLLPAPVAVTTFLLMMGAMVYFIWLDSVDAVFRFPSRSVAIAIVSLLAALSFAPIVWLPVIFSQKMVVD